MFRSEGIVEWGNAAVQGERRAVDVRVYFDSWAIFTFVLLSRRLFSLAAQIARCIEGWLGRLRARAWSAEAELIAGRPRLEVGPEDHQISTPVGRRHRRARSFEIPVHGEFTEEVEHGSATGAAVRAPGRPLTAAATSLTSSARLPQSSGATDRNASRPRKPSRAAGNQVAPSTT